MLPLRDRVASFLQDVLDENHGVVLTLPACQTLADGVLQTLVDTVVAGLEAGPENSREEMSPTTNGTLDCSPKRVAPAAEDSQ